MSNQIEIKPVPLCLIGGTGRSGTTILKQIFTHHPQCVRVPEYRLSIDPDGLVDFYLSMQNVWSPYYFDRKIRRLRNFLRTIGRNSLLARAYGHYMYKFRLEQMFPVHLVPAYTGVGFSRHSPNYMGYVDELMDDLCEFKYAGQWNGTRFGEDRILHYAPENYRNKVAQKLGRFWMKVTNDVCQHQNAEYFVEDNTWNILWFDSILKMMPHARLVHVIRDPRDVVASYVKMRWAPTDVEEAAKWFKGLMDRWFHVKESIPQDSYHEIRLHELVAEPRKVIGEAADFWGIPWHDNLLKENLGRSHTGRWKKDFNSEQQKVLNRVLSDQISKLGYE